MKIFTEPELKDIVDAHGKWLRNEEGGERATLQSTNLRGANLEEADLWNCVGNRSEIRSLHLETYSVTYTSKVMQIGCKRYTFKEWRSFSDEEIEKMDGKTALKFWRKWKDMVFSLVEMSPATPIEPPKEGE